MARAEIDGSQGGRVMDRDIGATDSVTIGAMNPIRARVRELLE